MLSDILLSQQESLGIASYDRGEQYLPGPALFCVMTWSNMGIFSQYRSAEEGAFGAGPMRRAGPAARATASPMDLRQALSTSSAASSVAK